MACGSETWVLSQSDDASLGVFERKILRAIFGPTNDNGEWRIRYNNELYTLLKEDNIVTYIIIIRLRWAGHVIQPEEESPAFFFFINLLFLHAPSLLNDTTCIFAFLHVFSYYTIYT